MNLFTIAWRNVGRNLRRSLLSGAAIAVATMSIVLLFSILEGMKTDLENNLIDFYTGEVQLRNPEYGRYEHLNPLHLSVSDAEAVRSRVAGVDGVTAAVARLSVPGAVFRNEERIGLQAVGVDFDREGDYSAIGDYLVAGSLDAVTGGASPDGTSGDGASSSGPTITPVLVGNGVLDRLGIGVGDTFTVVVRAALRGTNAMTFRAVAVADFPVPTLNDMAFWAPLARIQHLARMPGQAGEVLAKLDHDRGAPSRDAVMSAIRSAEPDLEVRHFTEMETTYSFIEMASTAYNIIGLFFFLLASTVIVNTTMMVIFERRREIGTLEAMGMQARELIRMFFSESLIIGVLGALAGLIMGVGVALVLSRVGINFSDAMQGVDFEISPVLYPIVNLRSTVVVFLFSVVVSGGTSYIPTRRITRIEPVAALREE